jgi:hypothetical protein
VRARQRRILQARVDELHVARVPQPTTRSRDQPLAGFDRGHPQATSEQRARQLTRTAADLEHRDPGSDAGLRTDLVDERVRISRAMTVIVTGNLVEDCAAAAGVGSDRHDAKVDHAGDEAGLCETRTGDFSPWAQSTAT